MLPASCATSCDTNGAASAAAATASFTLLASAAAFAVAAAAAASTVAGVEAFQGAMAKVKIMRSHHNPYWDQKIQKIFPVQFEMQNK